MTAQPPPAPAHSIPSFFTLALCCFLLICRLPAALAQAPAETPFCPDAFLLQPQAELEYHTFNKRDKLQFKAVHRVVSVAEKAGEPTAQVKCGIFSPKGKLIRSYDYYVTCRKGRLYTDRSVLFDARDLDIFENKDFRYEGQDIVFPPLLLVGDTIPQARYVVRVTTGSIKVASLITQLVQRRVAEETPVTTPAGTFSCYKVTYLKQRINLSSTITLRSSDQMADFVAPGLGVVRSETYSSSGKLAAYTVLVRKQP